uniref:3'-5' exonuclease n=1 Tax=viral metagenome TaxID=1070528 RepID=A0A6C0CGY9_9ZZZZ
MSGTVHFIETVQIAEQVCASLRNFYTGVIGFDTETYHVNLKTHPIDVIQFYIPAGNTENREARTIIFHVAKMISPKTGCKELPESLSKILTSKRIVKACSAPENDANWLRKAFGINLLGVIDIQSIAMAKGESSCGLDDLASKFIPGWKPKNLDNRFARWDLKLTPQMISYAADDAFASYAVLQALTPDFCRVRTLADDSSQEDLEGMCKQVAILTREMTSPHKVMRKILEQTASQTADEHYQRCLGIRVYNLLVQRGQLSCICI